MVLQYRPIFKIESTKNKRFLRRCKAKMFYRSSYHARKIRNVAVLSLITRNNVITMDTIFVRSKVITTKNISRNVRASKDIIVFF